MEGLVTFSIPQLVFMVVVLAAVVWFSVQRLISSIDGRFKSLERSIEGIRTGHPTRQEVDRQFSGVHRRIDDLRGHRRHDDETGQFRIPASGL